MEVLVGLTFSAAMLWGIGWLILRLALRPERARLDALDAALRELNQRLAQLEQRLPAERRSDAEPARPFAESMPASRAAPSAQAVSQPGSSPEAQPGSQQLPPLEPRPAEQPRSQPAPPTAAPAPIPALPFAPHASAATAAPARAQVSLETFLGGRVMLIVGVVVGLCGIAFFLKLAIDRGWIGPAARIAMGVLAGITLLAGGDRLRRRGYDVFGQALMGCGLGALYLSNYVACTRYGFLAQGSAFLVTAALTALGATLAIRRQAPALAWLGFLGAYLAPALLTTSRGDLGTLTAWLLVVHAGVLAVLMLRAWTRLDLMALAAAAICFSAWSRRHGASADPIAASGYLAALVAASLLLCLAPSIVRRAAPGAASLGGAAIAGVFGVVAAHVLLFPTWRRELGVAVLALGAAYLVAARLVASRAPEARDASAGLLGMAVAALACAIAVALSGNAVPLALSAAGVAVVYAGTRTRQQVLLGGGVAMVGLAFVSLLRSHMDLFDTAQTPFVNERFLLFASPCVALLVCGWLLSRVKELPQSTALLVLAGGLWALPLVIAADLMSGADIAGHVNFERRLAATTAILAVYGAVVARLFGAERRAPSPHASGQHAPELSTPGPSAGHAAPGAHAPPRHFAFGPILLAMLFGLWLAVDGHRTPFTPGWSVAFGAGLVLVAACLVAASAAVESARALLATIPLVYLLVLITAEIHAWGAFRPLDGLLRNEAHFVALVWISIAWAACAAALVGIGFWKRLAALRWLGLAVFGLTVGKVFLADLAGLQPAYRIGSFLVLGALLVAASFLYQRARPRGVA